MPPQPRPPGSAARAHKNERTRSFLCALERCYRHFWRFTRELLNDDTASRVLPQFSPDEAYDYFVSNYQSTPSTFMKPSWMPVPNPPLVDFEMGDFEPEEVEAVTNRAKSSSTLSPFDQIPYLILKKCPALSVALADLFNHCWITKTIPLAWKTASIKLLGKTTVQLSAIRHFLPISDLSL